MKKLFTGVIAAAALLIGFAGCSGDLHDDVKSPIDLSGGYYLVGSMTSSWTNSAATVVAFEDGDEAGTYKVPFSADAAEVNFAFIPTPGSWNGQIGGDKMTGGTMPTNAKFKATDNGNGGYNGTISGLEAKGKYKLVVTPLDDGTLKIDCSSNVPPTPFYLPSDMFIRGGMIDWNPSVAGLLSNRTLNEAKGILTYYVDFTCTDTTKNAYGIVNSTSNWALKYTGATVNVDADYVKTTKGADNTNSITGLVAGKSYRIYVQTTPDESVYTKVATLVSFSIKGCKLTGYTDEVTAAGGIYFLEGWVPGNQWNSTSPNKGIASGSGSSIVYTRDFASAYSIIALGGELATTKKSLQIVNWDGASGDTFWSNKVTAGVDVTCGNAVDGKSYYFVYDASTAEATLVAE